MPKKNFRSWLVYWSVLALGTLFFIPSINALTGDSAKPNSEKGKIIAIAAGRKHTLALRDDGTVWAWGSSGRGQLGNGAFGKSNQPVQVTGLQNVIAIAAGESHSLALKKDGTVWTWGINGCLGINDRKNDANRPVQVRNLNEVVVIGCGFNNSVAVKKDGTVWAWGDNTRSQLGKKAGEYRGSLPVKLPGLEKVTQATFGLGFGLAVRNNGAVLAWGCNQNTHLCVNGLDKTFESIIEPQKVRKIRRVKEVSGTTFILALKTDGTVWRWGDLEAPARIHGIEKVKSIHAGYAHCLAVRSDGTAWTWGFNDQGQLGNGNTDRKYYPPGQVRGLSGIIEVCGGEGHSVALSKDGTVWTWGMNDRGQLGDGTFTGKSSPGKVVIRVSSTRNTRSLHTNPAIVDSTLNNTVIKDLSKWNHPVKRIFETYGFKLVKVEIIPKNQLPIYIVTHQANRNIYDDSFLHAVADSNSYNDFIIVDNQGFVEVYCDKKQKKVIKAVTDRVQKNK
jgi:alpha-tubulin suppressor-like RCC1 family protein